MRPKTAAAAALIVCGVLAFAYQAVSYTAFGREMRMGWMHFATYRVLSLPLPPIVGTIALVVGIAWLLADKRDFDFVR